MEEGLKLIEMPIVQYGFAGMCIILLAFLFYFVKVGFGVLKGNTIALTKMYGAIDKNTEVQDKTIVAMGSLKDEVLRQKN